MQKYHQSDVENEPEGLHYRCRPAPEIPVVSPPSIDASGQLLWSSKHAHVLDITRIIISQWILIRADLRAWPFIQFKRWPPIHRAIEVRLFCVDFAFRSLGFSTFRIHANFCMVTLWYEYFCSVKSLYIRLTYIIKFWRPIDRHLYCKYQSRLLHC